MRPSLAPLALLLLVLLLGTTPSAAEYATMFSGWRTRSSAGSSGGGGGGDYSDGGSCSLTGAGVPSGVRALRTVELMPPAQSLQDAGHAYVFANGDVQVLVRRAANTSYAVRSSDRGATWRPVPKQPPPFGGRSVSEVRTYAVTLARTGEVVWFSGFSDASRSGANDGQDFARAADGSIAAELLRSADNGLSQTSHQARIVLPPALELRNLQHAPMVELPDGSLLAATYAHWHGIDGFSTNPGEEASVPKDRTFVIKSTDGGSSWAYLSTVAFDPINSTRACVLSGEAPNPPCAVFEGFNEPWLQLLPNGHLVCIMRSLGSEAVLPHPDYVSGPMYRSISVDGGLSWGIPQMVTDRGVAPTGTTTRHGAVVLGYGRPANWIALSYDGGATFSETWCYAPSTPRYDGSEYNSLVRLPPQPGSTEDELMTVYYNGSVTATFFKMLKTDDLESEQRERELLAPPSVKHWDMDQAMAHTKHGLSYAEQVLVFALQGLVNQLGQAPVLSVDAGYLDFDWQGANPWWRAQLEKRGTATFHNITDTTICGLISGLEQELTPPVVKGAVLYTSAEPLGDGYTMPMALSLSSQQRLLPVTPEVVSAHPCLAKFPVQVDMQIGKMPQMASREAAWRWAVDELLPNASTSVVFNIYHYWAGKGLAGYKIDPQSNATVGNLDYAVQHKAFILDLDPDLDASLMAEILGSKHLQPQFDAFGWHRDENGWVRQVTIGGGTVYCSFASPNLSFWALLKAATSSGKARKLPSGDSGSALDPSKYYVTFETNEGDTPRIVLSAFGSSWASPQRGSIPVAWAVDALLSERFPALMDFYASTATSNDSFIGGVAGAGYVHLGALDEAQLEAYATRAGRLFKEYMPKDAPADTFGWANWSSLDTYKKFAATAGQAPGAFVAQPLTGTQGYFKCPVLNQNSADGTPLICTADQGLGDQSVQDSCGKWPSLLYRNRGIWSENPGADLAARIRSIAGKYEPPFFVTVYGGLKWTAGSQDPRQEFFTLMHSTMADLGEQFKAIGASEMARLARDSCPHAREQSEVSSGAAAQPWATCAVPCKNPGAPSCSGVTMLAKDCPVARSNISGLPFTLHNHTRCKGSFADSTNPATTGQCEALCNKNPECDVWTFNPAWAGTHWCWLFGQTGRQCDTGSDAAGFISGFRAKAPGVINASTCAAVGCCYQSEPLGPAALRCVKPMPPSCAPPSTITLREKTDDDDTTPAGACSSDAECFGGTCLHDGAVPRCVCSAMWRGKNCELLSLAPAAVDGGMRMRHETTWGGGLIQDVDDTTVWHMFAARMISNCGLKSWTTNSEIIHGVASQIAGPYTRVKNEAPVLGTFSHNPSVQRVGPASYLLSHIGCGNGTKVPVMCTNGTTCNRTGWCQPNAQQQQPPRASFLTAAAAAQSAAGGGCDSPHWTGFMKSTSPRGPWTSVSTPLLDGSSCGLQVDGGPHAWHSPCITNPNMWPYDNGSVLVAYSTGCANCSISAGHKHIGIALARSGLESDEPLEDLTPMEPVFPWASEDPTIFLDTTNERPTWHVLAHTDFSGVAEEGLWQHVAAHAVAPDPRGPWTVVPYPPYNRTIKWSDGSVTDVYTRERPQLIFSEVDGKRIPVALTNGVTAGNASMPGHGSDDPPTAGFTGDWSFTHVQLIDLSL